MPSNTDPSPAIASRLWLARRIVLPYVAEPRVLAAFVHGSVARGTADQYSDIELGFIWSAAPSDAGRRWPREPAARIEALSVSRKISAGRKNSTLMA